MRWVWGAVVLCVATGAQAASHEVVVPEHADGAFRLRAERAEISVHLLDAVHAPRRGDRYPEAVRGGALEFRRTRAGVEDFVTIRGPDAPAELRYDVELVAGVEGLRLVSNTLELLDASGAPRLRVTRAVARGADQREVALTLSVEGCAVDTSPRLPWGRPPLSPGSDHCTVVVSWTPGSLALPAVVDPGWETTGEMSQLRSMHASTLLADGRVLVAGGRLLSGGKAAEVYDPATGTWATTGSMLTNRGRSVAVTLDSGRVLVAGGTTETSSSLVPTEACEIWDPATGSWSATASLTQARSSHTLTRLADGRVLLAGGISAAKTTLSTARIYSPTAGTWGSEIAMYAPRSSHRAVTLDDGRVLLVAGSLDASSEIFDPAGDSFLPSATMSSRRDDPEVVKLPDGRVLAAGGLDLTTSLNSAELYDPAQGVWTPVGNLSIPRFSGFAAASAGVVIVGAGSDDLFALEGFATTETFDPATLQFSAGPPLNEKRKSPSVNVLTNGAILLVGGGTKGAELLAAQAAGGACTACSDCSTGYCVDGKCADSPGGTAAACACDAACGSGFCTDGVCCDTRCDGTCQACTAVAKQAGNDGECGPVAPATDPDSECQANCAGAGVCGDQGACVCVPQGSATCVGSQLVTESSTVDCAPYACEQGQCKNACSTSADCAGGVPCNGGKCGGTAAASNSDDGGCGCRAERTSGAGSGLLAALSLLLLISLRRRR